MEIAKIQIELQDGSNALWNIMKTRRIGNSEEVLHAKILTLITLLRLRFSDFYLRITYGQEIRLVETVNEIKFKLIRLSYVCGPFWFKIMPIINGSKTNQPAF